MEMYAPLAERLRPKVLEDYLSQPHLVGSQGILTQHLQQAFIPSMIFWGPPGTGKTTLATIVSETADRPFYKLSAIHSGVRDVRTVIEKAKSSGGLFTTKPPIVFIDEIHRFNKSQQDSLLQAVEKGWITLIGATTENPSFEVIPALLSRCQVYVLNPLDAPALEELLVRAITRDERLQAKTIHLKETQALLRFSGGDARRLLNGFELIVNACEGDTIVITDALVAEKIPHIGVRYDKSGEQHYDIVSAFIKSIRGSDPNAAVYWLARMVEGGEDVKFIARRMLILASEDIGNANPTALVMANNTFQAVTVIGYPEARIVLSQCATYLACSPKSNAAYKAIGKAQDLVRNTGNLEVPLALRNAPTQLMKTVGYGAGYKYAHDYENNFVAQEFLPKGIENTKLYDPSDTPREEAQRHFLKQRWRKYDY